MEVNDNSTEIEIKGESDLPAGGETIEVKEPAISSAPDPVTGGQTSPPANTYSPNFKYKVLKEEKEFPDWIRGSVTTPEMEKTVREIFEKADGLEAVKVHRDQLVEFQKQWNPFIQDATHALQLAKSGDLESFFEKVGIPEHKLFEYALHRLNLREDPKALAAHEEGRRYANEIASLREQNESLVAGQQQLAVQQREYELSVHLGRAEISPLVQAFDSKFGAGSFRAQVIRTGQAYAAQGTDAPVESVVAEVSKLIGWQGQNSPPQPTPPLETGARATPPPSLPNIQGSGQAPAKRVPRSTDDIRRIAREMQNR